MNGSNIRLKLQFDVGSPEVLHCHVCVIAAARKLVVFDDQWMIECFQNIGFVLQPSLVFFKVWSVFFQQLHCQMTAGGLFNALPDLAAATSRDAHDELVCTVNQVVVRHDELLVGLHVRIPLNLERL